MQKKFTAQLFYNTYVTINHQELSHPTKSLFSARSSDDLAYKRNSTINCKQIEQPPYSNQSYNKASGANHFIKMFACQPSQSCCNNSRRLTRRESTAGPILQQSLDSERRPKVCRRTSFTTISVREYEQCLGDNPATQEGAPITLDWKYKERKSITLDEYEENRIPRRRRSELVLGVMERRQKLLSAGSSFLEVINAERAVAQKNNLLSGMSRSKEQKKHSTMALTHRIVTPRAA